MGTAITSERIIAGFEAAKRVSGKGGITHASIFMHKLNQHYGDRFKDELCFSNLNVTVI